MVRCKLLILSILCIIFFAQSCVHGDLDDCPPMVRYAVAFEYTNHTGKTDRFYDNVKKINLYVFDENNLIYTTATELSPYEKNFNIPLDIPMGNYNIIAWGNVLDEEPFVVTPDKFIKGETTLDEARFILQREANNMSQKELEMLFYGELANVEIPLYLTRIDTMPLTNNTNRVRVVLHWDHTGEIRETDDKIDYDEVRVRLEASNAVYNFSNQFTESDNVTYKPYGHYYTDSILNSDKRANELVVYYYSADSVKEVTNSCVYDFTILRMITNSQINLVVERKEPAVPDPYNLATVNLIQSFMSLFDSKGVIATERQNSFDKYEHYRVDLYFTYDKLAGEYVTGNFNIKDWVLVEQPAVPGAD